MIAAASVVGKLAGRADPHALAAAVPVTTKVEERVSPALVKFPLMEVAEIGDGPKFPAPPVNELKFHDISVFAVGGSRVGATVGR